MSNEKQQRNKQIFHEIIRQHKTYDEVAKEHDISRTRVRQIITQVREQNRPEYKAVNQHVQPIENACEIFHATPITRGRIYNALASYGYLKQNRWRRLSKYDLLKMKNLGELSVKIILKAQEL